ncbi:hypothetical protein BC351_39030 [Paenibacillus ferrarius]|uniref:Translation initiation inhibitor n=2 Tax=Paenibacillus ferrarius TaxID=1469647 RepID=A0A1V4H9E8_9BACL|nr:hypothetical protein BC351_39030 [Paenibacillus ferrarius]
MSTQLIELELTKNLIKITTVDETEYFITISFEQKSEKQMEDLDQAYQAAYKFLCKNDIEIFHERVFGSASLYETFDAMRQNHVRTYFNKVEIPYTYVGAPPFWGEGIAGIILHGINAKKKGGTIRDVEFEGQICGRMYEKESDKRLMLSAIFHNELRDKSYEQIYHTFCKINQILNGNGLNYRDVIRTWIYIPQILDYYDQFNLGRNRFLEELNIIPTRDSIRDFDFENIFMPASTGVGCENPYTSGALFDVYAISKNFESEIKVSNETGSKQRSAYRYGSAFSRSLIVHQQACDHLFLSGTASIDDKGNTIHLDNIDLQIGETFKVINSLVQEADMNVADWMEGTVFLKKSEYAQAYMKNIEENQVLNPPVILCVADICREDLLFEIDGIFAKKKWL